MRKYYKIPNEIQDKIAEDYQYGLLYQELAEKYCVSKNTVSKIINKRSLKAKGYHQHKWVNDHYFDNIDSEEKAYLLGFLIADGCIRVENDHRYNSVQSTRICFSNSEDDKEILDIIHSRICPNHKMLYRHNIKGARVRKPQYIIQWAAPNMIKVLQEKYKIVPRKTYDCDFEFPFESIPEELHRHFIRGFMDGDGSINFSELRFAFTSEKFMKQIMKKFEELFVQHAESCLDFKWTSTKTIGKTCVYWRTFIPMGHGRGSIIKDYLYKDATIFLHRKYNKAYKINNE